MHIVFTVHLLFSAIWEWTKGEALNESKQFQFNDFIWTFESLYFHSYTNLSTAVF